MSKVKIKHAVKKDVPLILSFIKELAEYEHLSKSVTATDKILSKNLFGRKKVAETLIAYLDGKPAGFAVFFHNFSTFLGKPGIYLEDLFVKPEFRGKGIGKRLFVEVARIAKNRDCGRLEWSVLNWNKPAIDFYKKLGAKPLSEWTMYRITGSALGKLAEMKSNSVDG
jgi:GNAT superfamily N-acetyltransferase